MNIDTLPHFSNINITTIEHELDTMLKDNRKKIDALLTQNKFTWNTLMEPLEQLDETLNQFWSPIRHLHAVKDSPKLREVYDNCIERLTTYETELGQNKHLYQAIKQIAESDAFASLQPAQQQIIQHALRDFHLTGVDLAPEAQQQFLTIQTKLAKLSTQFSNNVLDATQAWTIHIEDTAEIAGIPAYALTSAAEKAKAAHLHGWVFGLDYPTYHAVMTYAESRELREKMHIAFVTRASDQGPQASQFDNSTIMNTILQLRHEEATLLGYANYASLSLVTKMAEKPSQVFEFLQQLAEKSLPLAKAEMSTLAQYATKHDGIAELKPWDIAYYSEKLRSETFKIEQEQLRPYFPITKVLPGFFNLLKRLFGIHFSRVESCDVWHPDITCYAIDDAANQRRGYVYLDLYTRQEKREGAWMDECQNRRRVTPNDLQQPIAFVNCNFASPSGDTPALLTHDDVITLFHEFGHALHHLLTQVDYASVAGINGVPWDAVELPSQFLENWCWQQEGIHLISEHYQTGESLPADMLENLLAAKNFHSAMAMLRQIEFALFDFTIHTDYRPGGEYNIQTTLDAIRQQISVTPCYQHNRFQHSFSHIFSGGYAAGYYSYKWAEVLSSDAFSLFEETGIFNPATGQKFLTSILEQGGSREPLELFTTFRGREPTVDALLRHSGIT